MPALMGYLLSLDGLALQALAAEWMLSTDDATAGNLYREMTALWRLSEKRSSLPPLEREIVDSVANAGKRGISLPQLRDALPGAKGEMEQAVAHLRATGLLLSFPPRNDELIVAAEIRAALAALDRLRAASDPASRELHDLLNALSYDELQRLGQRLAVDDAQVLLRRELIEAIDRHLTTKESARQVARSLSQPGLKLLNFLFRAGGGVPLDELRKLAWLDDRTLRDAVNELQALFLSRISFHGERPHLFVPIGIGTIAHQPEEETVLPISGQRAVVEPLHEYDAAWDLLIIMAHLRDSSVRSLPLPKAARTAIFSQLRQTADHQQRINFLLTLAMELRLWPDYQSEAHREWVTLDFATQSSLLFDAWLHTLNWRDGLSRSELNLGGPLDLRAGRKAVCNLLAEFPAGVVFDLQAVVRQLRDRDPLMFHDRRRLATEGGSAAIARVASRWGRWGGRLAAAVIGDSLCWLGIISAAPSREGAYFVTGLGSRLIAGDEESISWPAQASLLVSGEHRIKVLWPDARAVAGLLELGKPDVENDGEIILTRERVRQARALSFSHESIERLLESIGLLEQPPGLRVIAWSKAISRARGGACLLIEMADAATALRLMEQPVAQRYRLRRVADTVLAADVDVDREALQRDLLAQDVIVHWDDEGGA